MKQAAGSARLERIRAVVYWVALLGGLVVDLITPRGYADWAFYLFAVVISMRAMSKRTTLRVAGAASVFTMLGFLFSPPGGPFWASVYSRAFGIVLIWSTVGIAMSWGRADEKLARLQEAVDGSNEIVFMTDPQGVFTFINPAFTRTYGYTAEEIVGMATPRILKSGLIAPEVYKEFWQMLLEKRRVQVEIVNKTKDGRILTIEGSASAILDARGNTTGFLGIQRDVSEQKRAKDLLEHNEERMRLAVGAASLSIWDWDIATNSITLSGTSLETLLGLKPGTFPQQLEGFIGLIHPEDRQLVQDSVQRTLTHGSEYDIEFRFLRTDGTNVWVSARGQAFRDAGGKPVRMIGVARDISDRRLAEAALRASETRYRRLFEAAKDGILILDADTGSVVDVNPFLTDLLGHPKEAIIGTKIWELGAFRDIAASRWSFAELQAKAYVRYDDLPLESSDGRPIEVEFVSNVYQSNGGRVIQCNIRDITDRKRAEAALRESDVRFQLIAENVADLIAVLDLEGRRLYNSPSYKELIGEPDEMRGTLSFNEIHPDDRERIKQIFQETVRTGRGQRAEFRFLLPNGNVRFIESQGSTIRDEAGKTIRVLVVSRDVTERKQLQEQLVQSQKMEAVGRLAGGVAHDFNNLLTVINGYSDLMLESPAAEGHDRRHLEEIRRAGQRAAALTSQLLAFSRKQIVAPRVLDLNAVVEGAQKMLRRIVGEDVEFVARLSKPLGQVKADPGQVEQVVMNLVINARDAMPKGGKLVIETSNTKLGEDYARSHSFVAPGDYVMLVLSDTGCGMDAETQAHIFEPFYTTKEQGKGTGLGLSTVFGIVKQSEGHINVYSEVGKGTTFRVYFPRIKASVDAVSEERVEAFPVSGTETVLLVEDEPGVRSLALLVLQSNGYTVLAAASPQEALALAAQHLGTIHLLLTDVIMPGLNGRELAIRLVASRPDIKTLFVSGYTADAIGQHGILDAGVAFLPKPFTPHDLLRKVRQTLDGTKI
jgi:two-component system, cell cycle sensor histidine kinase and response regulator CckA